MIDRILVMVQREVGGAARGARRARSVRRGVGEGRVLRATRRSSASCRRPCSCPGPTSTARSCSSSGTAPPVAVDDPDAAVRARARRLRDAPQDAAQRVAAVLGDRRRGRARERAGIDPMRRAETLDARRLGRGRRGGAMNARRRVRQAHAVAARARHARRRLPRPRRADGLGDRAARRRSCSTTRRRRTRHASPVRSPPASRPTTTNLVAARARICCDRTMAVDAAQGHPARRRPRRRLGRRRGGARARSAAPRSRRAALGSDVPFCLHRRPGVDARPRRDHRADRRSRTARPRDRDAAVRVLDRRRLPRVGRRSAVRGRRGRSTHPPGYPGPFAQRPRTGRRSTSSRACAAFRERVEEAAASARRCSAAAARRTRRGSTDDVGRGRGRGRAVAAFGSTRAWRSRIRPRRECRGRETTAHAWGGRCLLALLTTLPAGLLQQLLVLLLAHALAALLDQ